MSQTNAEYFIEHHQGDWRKAGFLFERISYHCSGWNIDGPDSHCERKIKPGDKYLRTGLEDYDGMPVFFCEQCAEKPA